MRKLIFITLPFFSYNFASYSQTRLEGKYVPDTMYMLHNDIFDFTADGHFTLTIWDDVEPMFGVGEYVIKDDELTLNFLSPPDSVLHCYKTLNTYDTNSDSVFYKCRIIDMFRGFAIKNALITLRDVAGKEFTNDSGVTCEYKSDNEGNFSFVFPKNKIPFVIRIADNSYKKLGLLVKDSLNRDIQFEMREEFLIEAGKTHSYKIQILNESELYLYGNDLDCWHYHLKKRE